MPCSAICACSVSTFPVMKHIYYLSFFLLSVSACDKDKFRPDYSNGMAEAYRNGQYWIATASASPYKSGFNMSFQYYNEFGELRQSQTLYKIPRAIGTYKLSKTEVRDEDVLIGASFYTLSSDGDVIEDRYLIEVDSFVSNIYIQSIDANSGWIKGGFNAVFYIDPDRPKFNPANPDTIRFTNGTFSAKLLE